MTEGEKVLTVIVIITLALSVTALLLMIVNKGC